MTSATFVLFATLCAAGPESPALEEVFRAGITAYDAQDFDGAIAEWDKLRRFRVEHRAVEYNLGNAYFRKQAYGRAVLHWERALRIDPADAEARENLQLVRTMLVDQVAVGAGALTGAVTFAQRLAPPESTALLAFVAWQLLGLSGFISLVSSGSVRRIGLSIVAVTGLVVIVTAPIASLQIQALEDRTRYVILAPVVEARSGPGEQFTTVFTVHEGLVVRTDGDASGWQRVRLPNGLDGWVPSDAIDRI